MTDSGGLAMTSSVELRRDTILDDIGELEGLSEKPESLGRQAWNRFRHHHLALFGVVLLVLLIASFWLGPLFSPYGVGETNVIDGNQGPSFRHPFGTDPLGRDYFVRAMDGGQFSIRIAVLTSVLATAIGLVVGALAGYFSGWLDAVTSFVVNSLLTIPLLLILIIFSREFGSSPTTVALVIAALIWLRASRLVRAQVLQLKESEFVLAARAAGAGPVHIMSRHLLPNLVGTLLVEVTLLVGTAIILESTLSFLGLGVQAPLTTLGKLVSENAGAIDTRPSRVLIPGTIITLIILSINFIGDALRDALDPKHGIE
jgi:ABC-type dipeptide/oligopeptide/nickel transport system permease subunit